MSVKIEVTMHGATATEAKFYTGGDTRAIVCWPRKDVVVWSDLEGIAVMVVPQGIGTPAKNEWFIESDEILGLKNHDRLTREEATRHIAYLARWIHFFVEYEKLDAVDACNKAFSHRYPDN